VEHFAWPAVVIVLTLTFLLLFRSQVAGFIDRTKSLKVPGIHAEGDSLTQVQAQSKSVEQSLIGGPEKLGTPLSDEVLGPMDQEVHRLIKASVPDHSNHLPWALRLLSHMSLQRDHEITARLIFNSQVQALRAMAQSGGVLNAEQLRAFYESAASQSDAYEQYSFDRWWNFLANRRLITNDGSMFHLTPIGRSYLAYVASTGISDPAAF
jgi:hypothetical protein